MSKDYHARALKGKRNTALNTIPLIEADLERYGSSGHIDAKKQQLIYALNVLITICQELNEAAHYDIYVQIFTEVLEPKLEPQASPRHWKRILSTIEYLFSVITNYNLHDEALKLHTYISKIQSKWWDIDDLDYLLSIHGAYLQMLLRRQQQGDLNLDAIAIVVKPLKSLEKLFSTMTERCMKESPIDFTTILTSFVNKVLGKLRPNQMQLFTMSMWCTEMESMFNAFFELNRTNAAKFISSAEDEMCAKYREHIRVLYKFLLMDKNSELKYQLALRHARILRSMAIFQTNEYIKFCSDIIYNLLKFTYSRVPDQNFNKFLSLLYKKFLKLLAESGKELIQQEVWFQDVIVFVCHHFRTMQNLADTYWQQLDTSLYVLQIKLFAEMMKIIPLITQVELMDFACCKNPMKSWFHIQLFCMTSIGLETYVKFLKHCCANHTETTCTVESMLSSIKTEVSGFLKEAIDILIAMGNECEKLAVSIRYLCMIVGKIFQEANEQCEHVPDLLSLATEMLRLKSRIIKEDWRMIMYRLNKYVGKTKDAKLRAEILSCYIANLISMNPMYVDIMTLEYLIMQHHHHYEKPGTSLFDIYMRSCSPFKPVLQHSEKRYFHWLEMQLIVKFYDKEKDCKLFTIMAQRSQSKYDFINAVHAGKLLNQSSAAIFSKVQNIYDSLINEKKEVEKNSGNGQTLTRLEELILGHTICLLLSKRLDEQKFTVSSSDFNDTNIVQLVEDKSFVMLSIAKEMELIDMAQEAFKAFQSFFNKADTEELPKSDGGYINWERILEDIISLAVYFQLTGYIDFALETWLLQYRIANTIDNVPSSLRSLAFFCEYNYLIEKDTRLNLRDEIKCKNVNLIQILENLTQLIKREQNYTLICVCQIAYYYACNKELENAALTLQLVHQKHKKLNRRRPVESYDIVLFTADIVSFRIHWKILSTAYPWRGIFISKYGLLRQMDGICERLQKYENISSADMTSYRILFLNTISDFAEFSAIRMLDETLNSYFSYALKICYENGLALRSSQLFCKWIFINLQMEYLEKAEIKMLLVECILGLRNAKELPSSLKLIKSCAMTALKELQNGRFANGTNSLNTDRIRREAIIGRPSPIKSINNYMSVAEFKFDSKLESCEATSNKECRRGAVSQFVLWMRFTLICLRARLNFLSYQYQDLQSFYENCEKWLEKNSQTIHFQLNQSTVLICKIHHANVLRASRNFKETTTTKPTIQKYIEYCATQQQQCRIDPAYTMNLEMQLEDSRLEEIEKLNRKLRMLKKKKINSIELATPIAAKPIKYNRLVVTTQKKSSSSSSSSLSSFKTTNIIVYSDRKSPQKTEAKAFVARKNLPFNEDINEKEKKNAGDEVIELSSHSDCDFDVAVAKTSKSKEILPKKQNQPKPSLKPSFLNSVDLKDFENPKNTKTTTNTKSIPNSQKPRRIQVEKPVDEIPILVDDLQKLTIESTSVSQSEPASNSKYHRSPNMSKKIKNASKLKIPCIEITSNGESSTNAVLSTDATPSTGNRIRTQTKNSNSSSSSDVSDSKVGRKRLIACKGKCENPTEPSSSSMSSRRRQRN